MSISPRSIPVLPDGRLTADDAAAYLGVTPKTLATWRCQGRGPRFVKFGRVFYFQSDLDVLFCLNQADGTQIWACDCNYYLPGGGRR